MQLGQMRTDQKEYRLGDTNLKIAYVVFSKGWRGNMKTEYKQKQINLIIPNQQNNF